MTDSPAATCPLCTEFLNWLETMALAKHLLPASTPATVDVWAVINTARQEGNTAAFRIAAAELRRLNQDGAIARVRR